jgi:hypothetical protein
MFDFAKTAIDYQWQALKHEEQAAKSGNGALREVPSPR